MKIGQNVRQLAHYFHTPVYKYNSSLSTQILDEAEVQCICDYMYTALVSLHYCVLCILESVQV